MTAKLEWYNLLGSVKERIVRGRMVVVFADHASKYLSTELFPEA